MRKTSCRQFLNTSSFRLAPTNHARNRFVWTRPPTLSPEGLVVYGLPNVNDPEVVAAGRGYDHAKWVAEKLLELASHETPIRPVIFRVGQVVGGSNGFWESAEWLPSILKCLPSSEQRISWVPLPIVSAAIVEMRNTDVLVADLVHPTPISWNTVFKRFSELLDVPLVPYAEWLQKLEAQLTVQGSELHALRLLNIYKNIKLEYGVCVEATLANVAKQNATNGSPSLKNAAKLTIDDADRWMSYWASIGFIPPLPSTAVNRAAIMAPNPNKFTISEPVSQPQFATSPDLHEIGFFLILFYVAFLIKSSLLPSTSMLQVISGFVSHS